MTQQSPERGAPTEQAVLEAQALLATPACRVRQWFLELEEHPERYQFETHAGFAFTEGGFGQAGARFQTTERFSRFEITLRFELRAVRENRFDFCLLWPPAPVWGAFVIEPQGPELTRLRLLVGGTNRMGRLMLRVPLLRDAVSRQIAGEIEHIGQSIDWADST